MPVSKHSKGCTDFKVIISSCTVLLKFIHVFGHSHGLTHTNTHTLSHKLKFVPTIPE